MLDEKKPTNIAVKTKANKFFEGGDSEEETKDELFQKQPKRQVIGGTQ